VKGTFAYILRRIVVKYFLSSERMLLLLLPNSAEERTKIYLLSSEQGAPVSKVHILSRERGFYIPTSCSGES
jgi:hypothetical protein